MAEKLGTVFVELNLDDSQYTRKEREVLQGAKTSSLEIERNWRTLGQHSDTMYAAMRQNAVNAYTAIANNAKSTASEITRAEQAKAATLKRIDEEQFGRTVNWQTKIRENWIALAIAAGAVHTAMSYTKDWVNASLAMERINTSMQAVAGTNAAAELKYIREESERLGLVMTDTATAYMKFAASARGTSLEGEGVRKIFSAVAEAGTAMKLSGDEMHGTFVALSQMMSKGKISAEELRQQLGERLPGAIQLMAKALGVTTAELFKLMEEGKLMSEDVLPKFAEELHKTYGEAALLAAEKGQAAINRFNSTLMETKAILGDFILPPLTYMLGIIRNTLQGMNEIITWDFSKGGGSLMDQLTDAELGNSQAAYFDYEPGSNWAKKGKGAATNAANAAKKALEPLLKQAQELDSINRKLYGQRNMTTWEDTYAEEQKQAEGLLKLQEEAAREQEKIRKEYSQSYISMLEAEANENQKKLNTIDKQEREYINRAYEAWDKGVIDAAKRDEIITRAHEAAVKARTDIEETEAAKQIKNAEALERERIRQIREWLKKSKDAAAGVSFAFYELYQNQLSWGEAGYRATVDTYHNMADSFSSVIKDGITGDLDDLGDYWDKFWKGLAGSFASIMGEMAAQWVLFGQVAGASTGGSIGGLAGLLLGGGQTQAGMVGNMGGIGTLMQAGGLVKGGSTVAGWLGLGGGAGLGTASGAIGTTTASLIAGGMEPALAAEIAAMSVGETAAMGAASGGFLSGMGGALAAIPGWGWALGGLAALLGLGGGDMLGAIGDVVSDIGSAIGDVAEDVGDAIGDLFDWHTGKAPYQTSGARHGSAVPASAFLSAPRLHSGFAPDEMPAVLKKNEWVFTPQQMSALTGMIGGGGGRVEVHVYLNGEELKKSIDDVIVGRNRRGIGPTIRVYK